MASPALYRLTPEEYLALERNSDIRHEYLAGEVFAMAGASFEHNQITGNVAGELRNQLRGKPCDVLASDMRVKVEQTGLFTYPDVVVVCGEPRFSDDELDTLVNPTVIVEVLSPTTEAYDRGKKFAHYRAIESLSEYVLIAQDSRSVEHYVRQPGDLWVLHDAGKEGKLRLASIGCEVDLGDIYYRVTFPPPGPEATGLKG